jgi:hypothetical protein
MAAESLELCSRSYDWNRAKAVKAESLRHAEQYRARITGGIKFGYLKAIKCSQILNDLPRVFTDWRPACILLPISYMKTKAELFFVDPGQTLVVFSSSLLRPVV